MARTSRVVVPIVFALAAPAMAQQDHGDRKPEFPYSMDFGPCQTTTLVSHDVPGVTHKALVVRLGDTGAAAFDTELLRMSAIWTDGWLDLRGTAYDGAHGPMPGIRGRIVAATAPGPGWGQDGDLADPRPLPYGPLPPDWGKYRGYWLRGDKVVFGYRIGDMEVKEASAIEPCGRVGAAARHFEFGPSTAAQTMVVLDVAAEGQPGLLEWNAPALAGNPPTAAVAALQWQPRVAEPVEVDASWSDWSQLSMGGPSSNDYLDQSSGTGAVVQFVPGFRRPHGMAAPAAGSAEPQPSTLLPLLNDGKGAANDEDRERCVWFSGRGDARLHVDLQRAVDVSRVTTFTWHYGDRSPQRYDLYGSDAAAAPALDADDPAAAGWRELAEVDTGDLAYGGRQGASVARKGGLGRFRHLLFVVHEAGAMLSEIDVYADRFRAAVDGGERPPAYSVAAVKGDAGVAELRVVGGRIVLKLPPHDHTVRCKLMLMRGGMADLEAFGKLLGHSGAAMDLSAMIAAGDEPRWDASVVTHGERGSDDGAYAVDTITVPFDNPYGSRMRVCAFDFFEDGRAAITTWNGDVWIVSDLDDDFDELHWQRFATGLYDPLGLRIVDDVVYTNGRDGITRLHDENGDGEADFYECFNHDVNVTNAFHEFAFDLQTDKDGNFYCSKGGPVNPGGRGFMTIAPHHGTIMKISKDGSSLEVIASGLRAPNGIGVSPDGIVTSGDNEGTWVPHCRLNWIAKKGYYAGVRDTAHREHIPDQPDLPLCWMPMEIDNSSGGQVWVTSDRWGPLQGRLLHLSYGTCGLYLVLKEEVDGQVQGGVVRFPCSFTSSAMRARFHPVDGQLYLAGFQGWQTSAARVGGFHRVRYTGKPLHMPVDLRTGDKGVYLTFAEPLDPETAQDPGSFGIEIWNYLYSQNYGSPELSILHPERKVEQGKPNRDPLPITAAVLSSDRRTVFLHVDGMQPVMQMKISYNVDAEDGAQLRGEVHNTIHRVGKDPGFPQ